MSKSTASSITRLARHSRVVCRKRATRTPCPSKSRPRTVISPRTGPADVAAISSAAMVVYWLSASGSPGRAGAGQFAGSSGDRGSCNRDEAIAPERWSKWISQNSLRRRHPRPAVAGLRLWSGEPAVPRRRDRRGGRLGSRSDPRRTHRRTSATKAQQRGETREVGSESLPHQPPSPLRTRLSPRPFLVSLPPSQRPEKLHGLTTEKPRPAVTLSPESERAKPASDRCDQCGQLGVERVAGRCICGLASDSSTADARPSSIAGQPAAQAAVDVGSPRNSPRRRRRAWRGPAQIGSGCRTTTSCRR